MKDVIAIRGARQHNLKNIDIDIPKNKFVVITGVSGSGKSSLAFDTIYAEGQRKYVESLSAYARQFLGVMDKPDVDTIDGLSPSISIDQKTVSHNPRSTVGTITEIYDFFRLLFARVGHPHCPNCNIEVSKLSVDEIFDKMITFIQKETTLNPLKPHQGIILSPIVRERKGEFKDLFDNLRSKGYAKVIIDNKIVELSDDISIIKNNKHSVAVIIDTISIQNKTFKEETSLKNVSSRLFADIEQSLKLSGGLVILHINNKDHLFSENYSCPKCGLAISEIEPRMFSFNSPMGACEGCKGIGTLYKIEPDLLLNKNLSIAEGAILAYSKFSEKTTWYMRLLLTVCDEEDIDINVKLKHISKEKLDQLLYGTDKTYTVTGQNRFGKPTVIYENFIGVANELQKRYFESSEMNGAYDIQKYMREETCDICGGQRLKKESLSVTINSENVTELSNKSVTELISYIRNILPTKFSPYETQVASSILKEIITRLSFLSNVGLSYLTISRAAKSLSGGELQRIRLASQIGTGLTGVLYVLDEPSIGLHPKDVSALNYTLHNLRDLGNTLIVVEHDKETIESADHIIELGPLAGQQGGKVVFSGDIKKIKKDKNSLTGQYLSGRKSIKRRNVPLNTRKGEIILTGATQYNLKNINIRIPLGNIISVTGVSGSGKSTLITETLYPALKYYIDGHFSEKIGDFKRIEGYHYIDRVYLVDQSPIGRTPRSNPSTYVGFFDEIRELFATTTDAKTKGFNKGRFSFNLKGGRCEKCQGAGLIKIEMQFLPDIFVICDVCKGKRYNKETLDVNFKYKNIYEVLEMTIDEARVFFSHHHKIDLKLAFLQQVGLGYIKLGQPAPTFSGGEAQRIKLVNELSRKETGNTLYILDEPTTGLHFFDIEKLLSALYQLADKGNTVIVIEHNLDVIKNSNYIIDMGPDGGEKGGNVVYQGTTHNIINQKLSYTAEYLRSYLS